MWSGMSTSSEPTRRSNRSADEDRTSREAASIGDMFASRGGLIFVGIVVIAAAVAIITGIVGWVQGFIG